MTEQDHARLLLLILRRRFDEAQACVAGRQIDPDLFLAHCRGCAVHPMIHERLEQAGAWEIVGEAVRESLGAARQKVGRDNLLLLARLEQALGLLSTAGVTPIVLKGGDTLNRLYPEIDLRTLDDVDLLVPWSKLRDALAALEGGGFLPPGEPARTHYIRSSHHLPMTGPPPLPVHFELHWNLAQEDRFAIDVEGLFRRARPLRIGGHDTLRMDDADLAAHLLFHHFTHYFDRGLKSLVDLDYLSTDRAFDWETVVARIREWKATAAAAACALHLRRVWPELIPQKLVDALPLSAWRRAATWPLRSTHPLDLYRGTRNRGVQLYLAAVLLERPDALPGWLLHRRRRGTRVSENPLDRH